MPYKNWLKFFSFSFVLTVSFNSMAYSSQKQTPHIIALKEFHRQTLATDSPIVDLAFDESKRGLWLLGQTNLWRWDFVEQRLQRYQLDKGQTQKRGKARRLFTLDDKQLAISFDRNLLVIDREPFRVTEFYLSDQSSHFDTLNIVSPKGDCCVWLRSDGIFQLDLEDNKVQRIPGWLPSGKRFQAIMWREQIWSISQNTLYRFNWNKDHEQEVYRSQEALLDLYPGHHDDLILVTAKALLRLDSNGQLIQIIPQRSQHPLKGMAFDEDIHSFLFSDGLLERYDFNSQTKYSYHLAGDSAEPFGRTIIKGPFVASIRDQSPFIFLIASPRTP